MTFVYFERVFLVDCHGLDSHRLPCGAGRDLLRGAHAMQCTSRHFGRATRLGHGGGRGQAGEAHVEDLLCVREADTYNARGRVVVAARLPGVTTAIYEQVVGVV